MPIPVCRLLAIAVISAGFCLSQPSSAAPVVDVTGVWDFAVVSKGEVIRELKRKFALEQKGNSIDGTSNRLDPRPGDSPDLVLGYIDCPTISGRTRIEDCHVHLTVHLGAGAHTVDYDGYFRDAKTMQGSAELGGERVEWTAKR